MARYSRRRGPASNFELTQVFKEIPGLSLSRLFDEGELLVSFRASYLNATGTAKIFFLTTFIDGVDVNLSPPRVDIANQLVGYLSDTIIVPIAGGVHTISLQAQGSISVADFILANTAQLTVVQLPLWDKTLDIL